MTRSASSRGTLVRERFRVILAACIACVAGCSAVVDSGSRSDPEPTAIQSASSLIPTTATASSVQSSSYLAAYGADNNFSTRWSSAFSDPQWLQLDLGSVHSIGEVKLYWENAYALAYQIQVSNDASTWTTIENIANGTGGTTDFAGLSVSARYVRMYGTKRATTYGYSLWEFQVFPPASSDAGPDASSSDGRTTDSTSSDAGSSDAAAASTIQLTGAVATASSIQSSSYAAAYGADNNFSTRWSSAFSDPQWLQLDFGTTKSLSEVKLYWENAYATAFQIQVSNDASSWTTIKSVTNGTGGTNDFTGLSASGRYVRMYGTQRATAYGYSLWEFQVFGPSSSDGGSGSTSSGDSGPASDAGYANCKRGMAYGYDSVADLTALSTGISWWYDWALVPDQGVGTSYVNLGVEFVPMQWGGNFSVSTDESEVPSTAKWLLGFNEPEDDHQANLTPQQAASLWPQMEQIAKDRNLKLVSPAVNYCGGSCNETSPFTWLDQFFAACTGCEVDAIAVHWYSCYYASSSDPTGLKNYIGQMKQYNKPIWLTEFSSLGSGCATDATTESKYMAAALPYLESEPAVQRYAWFTGRAYATPGISLLAASGQLTPLGQQYVSAPQSCGK